MSNDLAKAYLRLRNARALGEPTEAIEAIEHEIRVLAPAPREISLLRLELRNLLLQEVAALHDGDNALAEELDAAITVLGNELRTAIEGVIVQLRSETNTLRSDLTLEIDALNTEMDAIDKRLKAVEHKPQILQYISGGGGGVSEPVPAKPVNSFWPQGWN